jgi:hypothetical protein
MESLCRACKYAVSFLNYVIYYVSLMKFINLIVKTLGYSENPVLCVMLFLYSITPCLCAFNLHAY